MGLIRNSRSNEETVVLLAYTFLSSKETIKYQVVLEAIAGAAEQYGIKN